MGEYADEAVQREIDRRPRADERRPIPIPPPPPPTPPPLGGTVEWARWNLTHVFGPDDAAIIEWISTWPSRTSRVVEYASACHMRKWAGWQASLAWNVVEALTAPLDALDDDIPF